MQQALSLNAAARPQLSSRALRACRLAHVASAPRALSRSLASGAMASFHDFSAKVRRSAARAVRAAQRGGKLATRDVATS